MSERSNTITTCDLYLSRDQLVCHYFTNEMQMHSAKHFRNTDSAITYIIGLCQYLFAYAGLHIHSVQLPLSGC